MLEALIETYLLHLGFTYYDHPELGRLWGHPELGQGRRFIDAVTWQMGRERAMALAMADQ